MAEHNLLGAKGEQLAVEFLVQLGYNIHATNWKKRKFEIDIIAVDKEELVFVEVKTRSTDFYGNPEDSVTNKKQQHLINGADFYVQEKEIDLECRFDVIAIISNDDKEEVKHFKNAFLPEF